MNVVRLVLLDITDLIDLSESEEPRQIARARVLKS